MVSTTCWTSLNIFPVHVLLLSCQGSLLMHSSTVMQKASLNRRPSPVLLPNRRRIRTPSPSLPDSLSPHPSMHDGLAALHEAATSPERQARALSSALPSRVPSVALPLYQDAPYGPQVRVYCRLRVCTLNTHTYNCNFMQIAVSIKSLASDLSTSGPLCALPCGALTHVSSYVPSWDCLVQAHGSGEVAELMQQLPGPAPVRLQATSPEPAYKKTKLAHLRVKVPGGVSPTLPGCTCLKRCL